jgi:hypothetical protein
MKARYSAMSSFSSSTASVRKSSWLKKELLESSELHWNF